MSHDALPPLPFKMARLLPDPEVARWLALVAARLAAAEALADRWERIGALDPGQRRAASDLRTALRTDSSEAPA